MRDGKIVVAEVGVGPPEMCRGLLMCDRPNIHVLLFEPNPGYCARLRIAIGDRKNVELYEVAIGDEPGELDLLDEGTSSALVGTASPVSQHRGEIECNRFKVKVDRFSTFDKGDIDVLYVDIEGSEWMCLKHMTSRPQQITVEVYNDIATYINPYLYEICEWAEKNGYKRTAVHEGTLFSRNEKRANGSL